MHGNAGQSPRVFLAIDNCFAYKRWTAPAEWAGRVRDLGLRCIEASADTEADPLYAGAEYLADWTAEVLRVEDELGVEVVNLYSGHGTYSTLGLGHPDPRVRGRMKEQWIKPMIRTAAALGAGMGFFCHAFPHSALQDSDAYGAFRGRLVESLADVARFGAEQGLRSLGVEQMYAPHLVPWTISGAKELLRDVNALAGAPLYLTIDTGHAAAQHRFAMPGVKDLEQAARHRQRIGGREIWLGSDAAYRRFEDGASLELVMEDMRAHPWLFSSAEDGDPYQWLAALGAWSPIVHLQQVTGISSAHEPFTAERNAEGIIEPRRVLEAIAASYAGPADPGLPPPCRTLHLTLEIFAGSAALPHSLLEELRESTRFWRRAVPEDGMTLEQILARRSE